MRDPRLRAFRGPMLAFGLMLGLQALSGAVLFARKIGLSPSRVQAFYLGSEAAFMKPRTLAGLLEVAVPHLLAVPMVLFITLHLVGFVGLLRPRPFALLSGAAFGSALAGIASGFGVRYLWPGLAWVKIASFVTFEAVLLLWLALLAALFRPRPRSEGAIVAGGAEISGQGRPPVDPAGEGTGEQHLVVGRDHHGRRSEALDQLEALAAPQDERGLAQDLRVRGGAGEDAH